MALSYFLCALFGLSLLFGAATGQLAAVSAAALEGAGAAVELCLSMAGVICLWSGIMTMMERGGLSGALSAVRKPTLSLLGLPEEVTALLLLRPLSGSASLTALQEVFTRCGPDSRAGRIASVLMGASETIFYTLTVYLGATGLRKLPYVIPVSLVSYLAGAAVCALIV